MSISSKAKKRAIKKVLKTVKRVAFVAIHPFLPFFITFLVLLFAYCTVVDAIFVEEVQQDESKMSEEQKKTRSSCISIANYLNQCNNFLNGIKANDVKDMDGREQDKEVQWSHLYALMAFHNMADSSEINNELLEKVSKEFKSTFKYETYTIKTETKTTTKDENGNDVETTIVDEKVVNLLVESDTIMGHYKYNYEEQTVEEGDKKTTKKVFKNEELIGEQYARLKKYLKDNLNISAEDIDTDVQVVIQASNGYYDGKENTAWLQGDSSSSTVIDASTGSGLVPKGMFVWPIPGYTRVTSQFGMRLHPIQKVYKLHSGTDVGAPTGANFVAMADGKVITATYSNSYGNMVMIDHRKWHCYFVCTWLTIISNN